MTIGIRGRVAVVIYFLMNRLVLVTFGFVLSTYETTLAYRVLIPVSQKAPLVAKQSITMFTAIFN